MHIVELWFPHVGNICICVFCRTRCLVARALLNTSVHSVIGAMPICEFTRPHTEGATRTGARFAAMVSQRLQTCVVPRKHFCGLYAFLLSKTRHTACYVYRYDVSAYTLTGKAS